MREGVRKRTGGTTWQRSGEAALVAGLKESGSGGGKDRRDRSRDRQLKTARLKRGERRERGVEKETRRHNVAAVG